MHRIDTQGSVDSRFTEGNPNVGQRATRVSADWLNDVQENITYVIEEVGDALIKGRADQLYAAIIKLVAGAAGDGAGAVPTTRQVLGGGLVTGGGALANDQTLTVGKATSAEVVAGQRDDVAITPLALAGGLGGRSLAATGYITLVGGLIVAWGATTIPGNVSRTITLPITFPTMCAWAGVEGGQIESDAQDNNPVVIGRSAAAITVYNARDEGHTINYIAFGF